MRIPEVKRTNKGNRKFCDDGGGLRDEQMVTITDSDIAG
jgi:hypothetical protein